MKLVKAGITAARGYQANGMSSGIKKSGGLDLALVYSVVPAVAAAAFTSNRFKSSHITLDKNNLRGKRTQAILINSGNANCAVGEAGLSDARQLTEMLAEKLGIEPHLVLMASTGVIGMRLPVVKIKRAFDDLIGKKSKDKSGLAARAIMTTDTKPKQFAISIKIAGKTIKIGAMAKGAGMLEPHLATMLCFIATDAALQSGALKKALKIAVDNSFHRISIDGANSTNDSVIIMANGLAGNKKITLSKHRDFSLFTQALTFVCLSLARQIVLDGEGASKFIEIKVSGAKNQKQAQKLACSVADSMLFKAAIHGASPNWGRVLAACGSSGVCFDPQKLEISFGKIPVFKNGRPAKAKISRLKSILSKREVELGIDLNQGREESFIWTADLSQEYVRINAGYE